MPFRKHLKIFNHHKKPKDPFMIKEGEINDAGLRTKKRTEWVEEAMAGSGEQIESEFIGTFIGSKKFWLFLIVIIASTFFLFSRIAYIQIAKGEYYKTIAEGNRIRVKINKAPRGIIYDRNGQRLVENLPSFTLSIAPVDLPKDDDIKNKIFNDIAVITNSDRQLLLDHVNSIKQTSAEYYQSVPVIEDLDYNQAILLKIKSYSWPGINVELKSKRNYLLNDGDYLVESMSHILGYVGKISQNELDSYPEKNYLFTDRIGKNGLELFYEDVLRGKDGREEIEVDSMGRVIRSLAKEKITSGSDLHLTIDLKFQKKIEQILKSYLTKYNKPRATAIVMNPNNGEILAMASLPAFDNQKFIQGFTQEEYEELINDPDYPLFNRAISGEYPPGSTFKLAVGAAALEEGVADANTTVNSAGGIKIDQWFFPDWKEGGHGLTSIRPALAWSINTYFYMIGGGFHDVEGYKDFDGLGVERIDRYAQQFGFSHETGIDLSGERAGLLPNKAWKEREKSERWFVGDTYHLSIGQGDILVTPLQIANMTAFFANSGTLYKPHIVNKISNAKENKEEQMGGEILNKDFIGSENIDLIRKGLRDAVIYGSAQNLQNLSVSVAGKTGTAQWGNNKDPHAWFTCFAPYDNPEIVVTVLIEEGGEGSETALPIAKEILNWYFTAE